ncbi:hypothetical protein BaRGS_00012687, partial [Batillaria attramentaria]
AEHIKDGYKETNSRTTIKPHQTSRKSNLQHLGLDAGAHTMLYLFSSLGNPKTLLHADRETEIGKSGINNPHNPPSGKGSHSRSLDNGGALLLFAACDTRHTETSSHFAVQDTPKRLHILRCKKNRNVFTFCGARHTETSAYFVTQDTPKHLHILWRKTHRNVFTFCDTRHTETSSHFVAQDTPKRLHILWRKTHRNVFTLRGARHTETSSRFVVQDTPKRLHASWRKTHRNEHLHTS